MSDVILLKKKPKLKKMKPKRVNRKIEISPPLKKCSRLKIPRKMQAEFTRQMATLLSARLPLLRAIEIVNKQNGSPKMLEITTEVLKQIQDGKSFSEGLAFYPRIFNEFYVGMVRVGEESGLLDTALDRLAVYLEKMAKLQRKIVTALTYPAVIVIVAVGAIAFMLIAVVPTFADMFQDFGGELPGPTKALLNAGIFLKNNLGWILVFIAGVVVGFNYALCFERFKRQVDRFVLKIPLIGGLLKKSFLAKFCRTLGTLLSSGVVLVNALDVSRSISNNRMLQDAVTNMKHRVIAGKPLVEIDRPQEPFNQLSQQMIYVGEETGELESMLIRVTEFYEEELDAAIDGLTAVIEPVIIVFLGVVLGGTLVAMYLQLFNLVNVIE